MLYCDEVEGKGGKDRALLGIWGKISVIWQYNLFSRMSKVIIKNGITWKHWRNPEQEFLA